MHLHLWLNIEYQFLCFLVVIAQQMSGAAMYELVSVSYCDEV